MGASALIESPLRYHPSYYATLTQRFDYKSNRSRDEIQRKQKYKCNATKDATHNLYLVTSIIHISSKRKQENMKSDSIFPQEISRIASNTSHFVFSALGTVLGGEFNWGGCLLKCNGGAQRWATLGWKSSE